MTRQKRVELIKAIEEKRNSRVITYITGDRLNLMQMIHYDAVPILHEHLLAIPPKERKKLDLFIYSRGGESDIPWAIVSMFREYSENGAFSVLIPYRAHSGATVIALGADEIVMTKKAELGPIDITLNAGPHNPKDPDTKQSLPVSVEDVRGYFDLLKTIGVSDEEKKRAYEIISTSVNPLVLGNVSRLFEQTKLVAKRMLESRTVGKFDKRKIDEIVKKISTEIYSHSHAISRTEAINSIGLSFCVKAEDQGIDDLMWQLYCEYKDYFKMEIPFDANTYLIENDVDTFTWKDQPTACIESKSRFDFQTQSTTVNRLKNIPSQVSLELKGLSLPVVNVPNLPAGTTADMVAQFINQILPSIVKPVIEQAAQDAAQEFLKSLPITGYQRIDFAVKWNTEM
jgi:ClpP class serine protease